MTFHRGRNVDVHTAGVLAVADGLNADGISRLGGVAERKTCSLMTVWRGGRFPAAYAAADLVVIAHRARESIHVVDRPSDGLRGLAVGGEVVTADASDDAEAVVVGTVPPLYPEWLGDRAFGAAHGVRFPYVVGEMANGIASPGMVVALARADMLGFFGAAGLDLSTLERALNEIVGAVGDRSNWGVNLIHTPTAPAFEEQVAEVLLRRGVPRISASAFMDLTPAVVRCAVSGLRTTPASRIMRRTALFAKVSRPEVAEKFMSPAPGELLEVLIRRGQVTEEEARLAAHVPIAEDVTVEADSAGHTDRQSLVAVLPAIMDLRDVLTRRCALVRHVRVGAAGGLGDPAGVAGAFALGAAYVVTGSVNQMSVEAGVSTIAKAMLAHADLADVAMAPSADMFELGVQVQVLRRGTRYAVGARRLHAAYKTHSSLEAIPPPERAALEREVLGCSLDQVWEQTCRYWQDRDPTEIVRAVSDPKHRMALVFRWYLGQSSHWAIQGDTARRTDYQLWCSPAAGAFNRWTAGSFLAEPANRTVVQIARNLLEGAGVLTRVHQLRTFGVPLPAAAFRVRPQRLH